MCAICGIVTPRNATQIDKWAHLRTLLRVGEERGTDATGYGYLSQGVPVVHKEAEKASVFTRKEGVGLDIKDANPNIVIGHTRARTKGSEKINHNNHPITDPDYPMLVIHNGTVETYEDNLEKSKKFEVDSELIFRALQYSLDKEMDMHKAVEYNLGHVRGNQACAVIHAGFPDKVFLWRRSNPLAIAYDPASKNIYFASVPKMIDACFNTYTLFLGEFWQEQDMSNRLAWKMTKENELITIDISGNDPKVTVEKLTSKEPPYQWKREKGTDYTTRETTRYPHLGNGRSHGAHGKDQSSIMQAHGKSFYWDTDEEGWVEITNLQTRQSLV